MYKKCQSAIFSFLLYYMVGKLRYEWKNCINIKLIKYSRIHTESKFCRRSVIDDFDKELLQVPSGTVTAYIYKIENISWAHLVISLKTIICSVPEREYGQKKLAR